MPSARLLITDLTQDLCCRSVAFYNMISIVSFQKLQIERNKKPHGKQVSVVAYVSGVAEPLQFSPNRVASMGAFVWVGIGRGVFFYPRGVLAEVFFVQGGFWQRGVLSEVFFLERVFLERGVLEGGFWRGVFLERGHMS